MHRLTPIAFVLPLALSLAACQHSPRQASQYDELLDSPTVFTVKSQSVKKPLGGALEQLRMATGFEGGEVETAYREASQALLAARATTDRIRGQIDRMDNAAELVFAEWEGELERYTDPQQKADSAELLQAAKDRHFDAKTQMNRAYDTLLPVLDAMSDLTLSLRHRLYDTALGAVGERGDELSSDIRDQIAAVRAAIEKAEAALAEIDG